ncbi:MAG: hypothetical protein NC131_07285 [Roseburia sp.]|nr:hypothetical protein [Roseburia sp.]
MYLAGTSGTQKWFDAGLVRPEQLFVLESFVSVKDWQIPLIHQFKDFILDSGAFTFMNAKKREHGVDWYEYAERYATFVRDNQIERYFELDLDKIIGLKETTELRAHIEKIVGWPSIPVWHETRDKEYWLDMCRTHPYVAIGGITGGVTNRSGKERAFPWFIQSAHQHGAMIHGLGYTNVRKIRQYQFDSIDSTTWTSGGRYGQLHVFRHGIIEKELSVINGRKVRALLDPNAAQIHNFLEWVKFSEYCDDYLR